MLFLLSQKTLESLAETTQDLIRQLAQQVTTTSNKKPECQSGDESAAIRNILANNILTIKPKKISGESADTDSTKRLNAIDDIQTNITGISTKNLRLLIQNSSNPNADIQTYTKHISNVLFYNATAITTYSLFDENGIVRDFFLKLLESHITFSDTFLEGIKTKGSPENTTLYRSVVKAVLFMYVDTLLAALSLAQLEEYKKIKTPEETELAHTRHIANTLTPLRDQLFGRDSKISVEEQVVFVDAYVTLGADLQKLFEKINGQLSKSQLDKFNLDSMTIWDHAKLLLDSLNSKEIKNIAKTDPEIPFLQKQIVSNYKLTLKFKTPGPAQPQKSRFFALLNRIGGAQSVPPAVPAIATDARRTISPAARSQSTT